MAEALILEKAQTWNDEDETAFFGLEGMPAIMFGVGFTQLQS